jgi:hypothetical protein
MENGPFIDDFPLKPPFISIYEGFSMAMLNNQMVTNKNNLCVCVSENGEINPNVPRSNSHFEAGKNDEPKPSQESVQDVQVHGPLNQTWRFH